MGVCYKSILGAAYLSRLNHTLSFQPSSFAPCFHFFSTTPPTYPACKTYVKTVPSLVVYGFIVRLLWIFSILICFSAVHQRCSIISIQDPLVLIKIRPTMLQPILVQVKFTAIHLSVYQDKTGVRMFLQCHQPARPRA